MAAEKNFENRIKTLLSERGAWFIKYWGGGGYTKSGIPDLLVSYRGLFMGIELKAPNGRASDLQMHHLRNIDRSGGLALLLYPKDYERFVDLLDKLEAIELPSNMYEEYPFVVNGNKTE